MSVNTSPKKFSRIYSDLKIRVKNDPSNQFDDQTVTEVRRKISFDQSKTVKPNDAKYRTDDKNLEAKFMFKLSDQLLSFEMQQQRNKQLKKISSNPQLNAFYNCFKKIFMILYQTSHVVSENYFKIKKELFHTNQLQLVSVILDCQKSEWQLNNIFALQTLAKNIGLWASNPIQFERRIDLVARKVCLHNQKLPKIKNAFLNQKIQKYWKKIEQKFSDTKIFSFLQDQFEKPQQKLCFFQIQYFVKNKLCTTQFGNKIRKYCVHQEICDDMNIDFKFQFLLIQELCFSEADTLFKQQQTKSNEIGCEIM